MKITVIAVLALFISADAQAQALTVFNPRVYQGDTVVVRVNAQWRDPNVCVYAFGKHYMLNKYGYTFIGVGADTKQQKYNTFRVECGRGVQLDPFPQTFEVIRRNFTKTRVAGARTSSRTATEIQAINNAFSKSNTLMPDMANAEPYRSPVNNLLELVLNGNVPHLFGLIYKNNQNLVHNGVDLRMPVGTPIRSINHGKVVLAAINFSREGNMVIINHGMGIFSVYMHLSRVDVNNGNMVMVGQVIGLSGDTGAGAKNDPHLHFSIKVNGIYTNPIIFINNVRTYVQ